MKKDHMPAPFSSQDQPVAEQSATATVDQRYGTTKEGNDTVLQQVSGDSFQLPVYDKATNFSNRTPSMPLPPPLSTKSEIEYSGQFTNKAFPTVLLKKRLGRRQIKMIVAGVSVVVLTTLLLLPLFWVSPQLSTFTSTTATLTSIGQVVFSSSGQLDPSSAQGINDIVTVTLHSLENPAPGSVLYAWLLPDQANDEVKPIKLGALTPNHGNTRLTYSDPNHADLLVRYSAFRITQEENATTPDTPSLDHALWRYSGGIPAMPTPGDENHYSLLSHLRHLLAKDPNIQAIGLSGGLDIWLDRNSEKILEYAIAARDDWSNHGNTDLMHRQIVRILQYLDGVNYSWKDTPNETPWLIDPLAGHIGLLDLSQDQAPPGYLSHVLLHLNGLANSPGASQKQKQLAIQVNADMQNIVPLYKAVRNDAITLVKMSNQQLQQSDALSLLNDMATRANTAYSGQQDPATGKTQPGISAIHGQLQTLGTFYVIVNTE